MSGRGAPAWLAEVCKRFMGGRNYWHRYTTVTNPFKTSVWNKSNFASRSRAPGVSLIL